MMVAAWPPGVSAIAAGALVHQLEVHMARGPARFAYGETRFVSEYVAARYPDAIVKERMRLGPLVPLSADSDLTDAELKMVGVFRRFADAVVITKSELIVVEGKMRSTPGAVAQLHLYQELLDSTFDLYDYLSLPRALELVVAIEDPAVTRMAVTFGVRVATYRPAWLPQWMAALHPRESTPHIDFVGNGA